MSAILSTVNKWMFMIYAAVTGFKMFAKNEFRRIRDDESGIEVVQVVIILLIVVIIAAAIWLFLAPMIQDWFATIGDEAGKTGAGGSGGLIP